MDKERLYTTKEAAEYLGVHPNTVRNMINDGRLTALKTRGRTGDFRFRQIDLDDYVENDGYSSWHIESSALSSSQKNEDLLQNTELEFLSQCGSPFLIFGTYLENLPRKEYSQALRGKAAIWVQETFRQVRLRFHSSSLSNEYSSANEFLHTVRVGVAGKERADGSLVLTSTLIYPNDETGHILDGTLQQFHPELNKGIIQFRRNTANTFYLGMISLTEDEFLNAINDRNSLVFQNFLQKLNNKRRTR